MRFKALKHTMKTILQINKFHYIRGGAERYYFNLSDLLEKKGHQVVHFSTQSEKNIASEFNPYFVNSMDISHPHFGISGLRKAFKIIYSFESKRKLEALVKKTRPDVAHVHNIYHHLSPSILPVLKKYHIPVVMSLHDYKLISPNYQFLCNEKVCEHHGSYYREMAHRSIKNSYTASALCVLEAALHDAWGIYENTVDLFLAPSEFLKNKFVEYGFREDRIKVLPYTLDLNEYNGQYPVSGKEKYILFFGRLSKEKGVRVLIDAMKIVKNGVKLKIVGEGPLLESLRLKIKKEKISNVEFLGFQTGDELKRIIAGSAAVVVPSIWYENSPLVIYEAMALGKVIIGSRIGGIPELVDEGKTGLLFDAGDYRELATKIDYIWENDEGSAKLGEEAKRASAKFDFETHYGKIKEIYSSLQRDINSK